MEVDAKKDEESYDEIRRKNIERNNAFLQELGLEGVKPVVKTAAKGSGRGARRKRTSAGDDENGTPVVPIEPTRRSSRVRDMPAASYVEDTLWFDRGGTSSIGKSARILDQPFEVNYEEEYISREDIDEFTSSSSSSKKRVVPSKVAWTEDGDVVPDADEKNKSKFLDANIPFFLQDDILASPDINARTKSQVMHLASKNRHVRFSKYSGVVEWKNCVFLWVNVPAPGVRPDYPNRFRDSGQVMSWFGGSRMHAGTPVVERMQREGQAVLLFVRFEGESYTCLGRLKAEKTVLDRHPISFVWRLLDWGNIKNNAYFKKVMDFMLDP